MGGEAHVFFNCKRDTLGRTSKPMCHLVDWARPLENVPDTFCNSFRLMGSATCELPSLDQDQK